MIAQAKQTFLNFIWLGSIPLILFLLEHWPKGNHPPSPPFLISSLRGGWERRRRRKPRMWIWFFRAWHGRGGKSFSFPFFWVFFERPQTQTCLGKEESLIGCEKERRMLFWRLFLKKYHLFSCRCVLATFFLVTLDALAHFWPIQQHIFHILEPWLHCPFICTYIWARTACAFGLQKGGGGEMKYVYCSIHLHVRVRTYRTDCTGNFALVRLDALIKVDGHWILAHNRRKLCIISYFLA